MMSQTIDSGSRPFKAPPINRKNQTQRRHVTKENTAVREIIRQITELEAAHPEQEMRPWACKDHPIALKHWGLVQQRIRLARTRKTPTLTVEQRISVSKRLRA